MRVTVATLLATAAAVSAQSSALPEAPKISDSPAGAAYIAKLPEKEGTTVRGSVNAISDPNGKGTVFSVAISGLPAEGGPFMYHIHEKPVPADGNCTGTGAHLDPYKRGEVPVCDPSKPETCQVGDLSGKHSNFTQTSGSQSYTDAYLSTSPNDISFFGNLSIVVHNSTKARLSCANFTLLNPAAPSSSGSYAIPPGPTGTGSASSATINSTITTIIGTGGVTTATLAPTVTTGSPSQPSNPSGTNGAERLTFAGAGVLAGLAAFVL